MSIDDPHLAVGAYVLHALPPAEEAAFENHLAGCASCRREADRLAPTTALLVAAESLTPPADLRRRVLAEIACVRPDRPSPGALRRPRLPQQRLRLTVAACLAAAVALGGVAAWQHSGADIARLQLAEVRSGTAALADVLAAPDGTIKAEDLSDGATASVIASRSHGRAALIASGLPSLTEDKVYELWYVESGRYRPAGLLPAAGGRQSHILEGPLKEATAVCITVEPVGGSAQPTTDPMACIRVPA
ncbi:anti-sigma-K factor RskA [Streptomyces sp. V4I23]|uniref:anti-sigma factor n=1 Tax=Streptomyces sp. V4I23 TaxID=3042282 RepID=UPI0027804C6E|nr:anti-sigma factor [Streptomyces sp. V4I23]MDQ1007338.1 anti-sigma-K factor RskA [Streptomyces sp. V4I23]